METKLLIKELESISKGFMEKKEFHKAGRINMAIDVINETLLSPPSQEEKTS